MAKEDKTNSVAAQAAALAAGGGDDAAPATPPAPPAAALHTGPTFVCKESFTLNERTFGVGEKLTSEDLASFEAGMLDRRIKNGFIGFDA